MHGGTGTVCGQQGSILMDTGAIPSVLTDHQTTIPGFWEDSYRPDTALWFNLAGPLPAVRKDRYSRESSSHLSRHPSQTRTSKPADRPRAPERVLTVWLSASLTEMRS